MGRLGARLLAVAVPMLHDTQQCSSSCLLCSAVLLYIIQSHLVHGCMYCNGSGMWTVLCAYQNSDTALPHRRTHNEDDGLLGALNFSKYHPRVHVVANTVRTGASKVQVFEQVHALLEIVYG